jgi:hypothetical protein
MSEIRRFTATGLEEATRRGRRRDALVIGALDETGQEKVGGESRVANGRGDPQASPPEQASAGTCREDLPPVRLHGCLRAGRLLTSRRSLPPINTQISKNLTGIALTSARYTSSYGAG